MLLFSKELLHGNDNVMNNDNEHAYVMFCSLSHIKDALSMSVSPVLH